MSEFSYWYLPVVYSAMVRSWPELAEYSRPDKHPEKWLAVLQKASQAQAYWRVKIEVPCVHQFPFSLGGTKSVPCWRALVDSEIPCVLNILELMALDVAHGTMASHADVSVLIQRTWKHIITWKNWIQVAV